MTVLASELREGVLFVDEEKIFKVLKYQHTKLGRGNATVRVRVKDLRRGAITERTYSPRQRLKAAPVSQVQAQYLYRGGGEVYFMNAKSFEEISLPEKLLGDQAFYLKEGMTVEIREMAGEALEVIFPAKVALEVVDTMPGVKGNSATNVFKEATLETGLKIKVPMFVDRGDRVTVDTRRREYVDRSNRG
jgi:elongation factor P